MNHLVVTGGTGGVGRAISVAFEDPEWRVSSLGRHDLDLTTPGEVDSFFQAHPVDLLVCAAGMTRDAPLAWLDEASWDETLEINFSAARRCAEAAIRGMLAERRAGHVIFISSRSATHPPVGQAAYAAAKAALLGLTTALAARHGSSGIRVNAISPGFLETAMTRQVSPRRRAEILSVHALGRFNSTTAVAEFIRFLHERLPDTSGQIFQLDSRPGIS